METPFTSYHVLDSDGNPSGGCSYGDGFCVSWQRGPLGRGDGRKEPNGAFVETLLGVVRDRIQFYEDADFGCDENREALDCIKSALAALNKRTARREASNVEGTHEKAAGDDSAG